jgi:hypothetical protein
MTSTEEGKMTTQIHSNGSKWLGQAPDPIKDLLARLEAHAVCERRTTREALPAGVVHYAGNFAEVSAVWSVFTDDPAQIAVLDAAYEKQEALFGTTIRRIDGEWLTPKEPGWREMGVSA